MSEIPDGWAAKLLAAPVNLTALNTFFAPRGYRLVRIDSVVVTSAEQLTDLFTEFFDGSQAFWPSGLPLDLVCERVFARLASPSTPEETS